MDMSFEVLGPLRVTVDGTEVPIRRPARRRLLALLLLEPGVRQSTDLLIERFWGDDAPANPKAALQTHLSALRGLLPDGTIVTEGYGYRLAVEGGDLDVRRFTAAVMAAQQAVRRRDWSGAEQAAEAALGLWRGVPFLDLSDDFFARPERTRFEQLRSEVEEVHAHALLEQSRADEALRLLEPLVAAQPLRERRWHQLMLARYRMGRQAEALDAYRQAREALEEVGLEPGRDLQRLQARILHQDPSLVAAPPHNLPLELSSFVGRDRERRAVAEFVAERRLVTLTGVGGAGKTRLGLRVAHDLLGGFPDGVWLVELAPVRDGDDVPRAVATALGVRPGGEDVLDALGSALLDRTLLVVLDNCEHQLAAAAATARSLLETGPSVKVLATSREPLGVVGEIVYPVPPLGLPAVADVDVEHLRDHDAIRLFEDRAASARPGYRIDDDAEAVAELCRRLDGVPLAIELAAARVRSLSVATVASRLDQRFQLLTSGRSAGPSRQRTLEATVRWSYDLLSPVQRTVFVRLGVFHGDIGLAAAERIVAGEGVDADTVVPVLSDLVDRSLVTTSVPAPDRYRLLETLRVFAVEELDRRPEVTAVRRRHRDWYLALADEAPDGPFVPGRRQIVDRLADVSEDLAAALAFARAEGAARAVVGLARALAVHWIEQGHVQRAITHLELALDLCDDATTEAELRTTLGAQRFVAGDVDRAFEDVHAAATLARAIPASRTAVQALARYARSHTLLVDRNASDGIPPAREALAMAETINDPHAIFTARLGLVQSLAWSGASEDALEQQRLALELAEHLGDPEATASAYATFADLLYLHPTRRRWEPGRMAERALTVMGGAEELDEWYVGQLDWALYPLLQVAAWDDVEALLDRLGRRHVEGYKRTWHLMVRATLRWMQGRNVEARGHLDAVEHTGLNPRWFHDYFPLRAEIAADDGSLKEARDVAERYLAFEVDAGEMPHKLAVLPPLVRAEVDAALAEDQEHGGRHAAAARATLDEMHRLATRHPHPTGGALQLETAATHVVFGEAEVSRLRGGDEAVAAWRRAAELADFEYYRLYAAWRLAEAAVETGHPEGPRLLTDARTRAHKVGAQRLADELDRLAGDEAALT